MEKTLRIVYEGKTFFGVRTQYADTTTSPTHDDIVRAMNYLRRHPLTTAIWIHTEDKSYGFLFDDMKSADSMVVTMKISDNYVWSEDYVRGPFTSARKYAYELIDEDWSRT